MAALTLIVLPVFTAGFVSGRTPRRAVTEPVALAGGVSAPLGERAGSQRDLSPGSVTASPHGLYRHRTAAYWARRYRHRTRQLQAVSARLRRRWQPTVAYALRLASAVYGVAYSELRSVAWCESKFDPFARNGRYLGIFQMHWSPFGFSPFDPVASALSAAATVRHDGSWRQWQCQP